MLIRTLYAKYKIYFILAGVAVLISSYVGVALYSCNHCKNKLVVKMQKKTLEQVQAARQEEREKQENVNVILQNQNDELATINAKLATANERLHERANRRHLPKATQADCTGATGAELSRQDAGFLIGEAARADELRAALKSCYSYADTVTK